MENIRDIHTINDWKVGELIFVGGEKSPERISFLFEIRELPKRKSPLGKCHFYRKKKTFDSVFLYPLYDYLMDMDKESFFYRMSDVEQEKAKEKLFLYKL